METIEETALKKTILFGSGGMLGHALREVFPHAIVPEHRELDITDPDAVQKFLDREQPAIVINAAAYTDVDGCEENLDQAFAVNGRGPEAIARACAGTGAVLVHFSTDYVFDGTSTGYREDAVPNPINVYGKSKLAGESAIIKTMADYRIIRTSWLYGSHGRNFVDTILSRSRQVPHVRVVNDQRGKPTYSVDLARKTQELLSYPPGIYHITNDGVCSWYEFAGAFIPNAVPCSSAEYPQKAKRPANSVLINTKTEPLRHWREALNDYLGREGSA